MSNRVFALLIFTVMAAVPLSAQIKSPPPTGQPQAPVPQAPALSAPQGRVSTPAGPVDILQEPIVKIVANVQPAVVNITAEETVPEYYTVYDQFFRRYKGVRNHTAQSIGSGLIISADGFVITNSHVVALAEKEKEVNVTLSTGSKYRAVIVSADDDADLALLKIEDQTAQYPYFDLSYTSPNLLGETVVALGSPAGYQNSVSHGILSALHRSFTAEEHTYNNLIQTDAAINPGNSGGPLIDLNGGLVGINSAKLSGSAIENIGFAISNDVVIPWVNDAIAVAKGTKPPAANGAANILDNLHQHLGITLKTLSADDAGKLNLQTNGGLLVTRVDPHSPADDAGIRKDMVIVKINSRQVIDARHLPKDLAQLAPGGSVRLDVILQETMGPVLIQRGGSVTITAR